jgi:hypothetical protein
VGNLLKKERFNDIDKTVSYFEDFEIHEDRRQGDERSF